MKKILFSALVTCLGAIAFGGEYVVVANKDCPVSEVSKADLKRVYVGKVTDIGGTKVSIANLALDNPAAEAFLMDVTAMNSSDYKSFWMAQQIRGGSTAPLVKKTAEVMIEFVKENAGNVGYVPKDTPTEGVKVLTVK